jgi:hypothetical protein
MVALERETDMTEDNDQIVTASLECVRRVDAFRDRVDAEENGTDVDELWGVVDDLRERLAVALAEAGVDVASRENGAPAARM